MIVFYIIGLVQFLIISDIKAVVSAHHPFTFFNSKFDDPEILVFFRFICVFIVAFILVLNSIRFFKYGKQLPYPAPFLVKFNYSFFS